MDTERTSGGLRSGDRKARAQWFKGRPPKPGVYRIWDGFETRRVRWSPGYRWRGQLCEWRSLRGYPVVWPDPLEWCADDPNWGISLTERTMRSAGAAG